MSKTKYVKLGEKASLFFDPLTGLKVLNGDRVELKAIHRRSKRVKRALQNGHLVYTSEQPETETENNHEDGLDINQLKKLNKKQLIEKLVEAGTELSEEDLSSMKKQELIEELFELSEEYE